MLYLKGVDLLSRTFPGHTPFIPPPESCTRTPPFFRDIDLMTSPSYFFLFLRLIKDSAGLAGFPSLRDEGSLLLADDPSDLLWGGHFSPPLFLDGSPPAVLFLFFGSAGRFFFFDAGTCPEPKKKIPPPRFVQPTALLIPSPLTHLSAPPMHMHFLRCFLHLLLRYRTFFSASPLFPRLSGMDHTRIHWRPLGLC